MKGRCQCDETGVACTDDDDDDEVCATDDGSCDVGWSPAGELLIRTRIMERNSLGDNLRGLGDCIPMRSPQAEPRYWVWENLPEADAFCIFKG